jgi:hypothetical protein
MVAVFQLHGKTIIRRSFTLKFKRSASRAVSGRAAETGGLTGALINCLDGSQSQNGLPTLSAGAPTITGTQWRILPQWTVHQTVLYRTGVGGQWIEAGRTFPIYGRTNNISPVGSWGDAAGWWIWNGSAYVATNNIDWTYTGRNWWTAVHYVQWLDDNGTWGERGFAYGQHFDTTPPGPPGVGGGGPVNLGTPYNYCFIQ